LQNAKNYTKNDENGGPWAK